MNMKRLFAGEHGFTLIEILVTLAITGIVALGAMAASYHVLTQSTSNTEHTSASQNALNAVHWISRDVQMAQVIDPQGASGFPLSLRWTTWDNADHEIVFSLEDGILKRQHYVDSVEIGESIVAQYINPTSGMTGCTFNGGVLTLKITATVGTGVNAESVSKVREIAPRPGL